MHARCSLVALLALGLVGCQASSPGEDAGPTDSGPECVIGGDRFSIGEVNPANACQICSTADPANWSPVGNGVACGENQACHRGRCLPQCLIDGRSFTAGQRNPDNFGLCCNPWLGDSGSWQPFFTAGPTLTGGGGLDSVIYPPAHADFNGDGLEDVASFHPTDGGVAVRLTLNDGAFFAPVNGGDYPLPTGADPIGLIASDLDGDSAPDVLVIDALGTAYLWHNLGNGTLAGPAAVPLQVPPTGGAAVLHGLSNLGSIDVAITAQAGDGGGTILMFEPGAGGLFLVPRLSIATDEFPWSPQAMPWSVGRVALLFEALGTTHNQLQELYFDEGRGHLVDPVPAVSSLNGIGVGDIDGDGIPDAIGANFYEYGISVALGLSDGGLSPWVITVPDTTEMPDIPVFQPNGAPVVADFEGSGTSAIAVTSFDRIWLFWPLADGGLVPVVASDQHWGGGDYIRQLSAADFNGDGSPDLLVNFANVTANQVAFNGCP